MPGAAAMPSPLARRTFVAAAAGVALLPAAARARGLAERFEPARRLLDGAVPRETGLTLDLPLLSEDGTSVPLTVAVDSPMSEADHVREIHLLATRNPSPEIASFTLTPTAGRAEIGTRVRLDGTQSVIAIARTSTGAVLATSREVKVTTSGCLVATGERGGEELATRIRVPPKASRQRPGEVLTIVTHPMETGLRPDASGTIPPQRIVARFEAALAGRPVLVAELHRAIAANPYLRFFLAPEAPGELRLIWTEDTGRSVSAAAPLAVG
jgi:sulfur-oxidizing protein SoxY